MQNYDIGDIIRTGVTFTNSAGAVVTPDAVTFKFRKWLFDPSSITNVTSIANPSTGEYYADIDTSSGMTEGEYRYRWQGTGNNAAASEGSFKIRVRAVG